MASPRQRHRANRTCRTTESCLRYMWIRNTGDGVLALPSYPPRVRVFGGLDFDTRFFGFWQETFVPNAFIKLIGGRRMASAEQAPSGV